MDRIVIASNNAGKLKEIQQLMLPLKVEVLPQSAFNIPEAEEPHPTFIENALAKARHASRLSGLPAVADDSGLCVTALGGEPGVLSARYAGEPKSDQRNNEKLIEALKGVSDRSAYFYSAIVLVRRPDDPRPVIAEGMWYGRILEAPKGAGGFGYDPLFFDPEAGLTAAEMPLEAKNAVSHRGQAFAALVAKLAHHAEHLRARSK